MKTILITGSTDGVGRVVARRRASPQNHLLVHGRDRARGASLIEEIARAGGSAEFIEADFASLADVSWLANAVSKRTPRLDLLINNAGIGSAPPQRQESIDGHELRFAVNYLAGFLLTHLLRPAFVVNVSSAGQQAIDFDDVMLTKDYTGARAYCQSKLAQIMHAFDLAVEGVHANVLHPSHYMDTNLIRQSGRTPLSTTEEGADAIIHLSTEWRSGLYFDVMREARAHEQAYDEAARRRLRALSLDLIAGYLT